MHQGALVLECFSPPVYAAQCDNSRVKTASATTLAIAVALFCGCTVKPPPVPPKSPECLAAIQTAAARKAKWETGYLKIKENIETSRLELKNLELENQISLHQTGLRKNKQKIAFLKVHIETNELLLRRAPDEERSSEVIDQWLVDAACKPQAK